MDDAKLYDDYNEYRLMGGYDGTSWHKIGDLRPVPCANVSRTREWFGFLAWTFGGIDIMSSTKAVKTEISFLNSKYRTYHRHSSLVMFSSKADSQPIHMIGVAQRNETHCWRQFRRVKLCKTSVLYSTSCVDGDDAANIWQPCCPHGLSVHWMKRLFKAIGKVKNIFMMS